MNSSWLKPALRVSSERLLTISFLGEGAHALVRLAADLECLFERQISNLVENALGLAQSGPMHRCKLLRNLDAFLKEDLGRKHAVHHPELERARRVDRL